MFACVNNVSEVFYRSFGINSTLESARGLDDFSEWVVWALMRALTDRTRTILSLWIYNQAFEYTLKLLKILSNLWIYSQTCIYSQTFEYTIKFLNILSSFLNILSNLWIYSQTFEYTLKPSYNKHTLSWNIYTFDATAYIFLALNNHINHFCLNFSNKSVGML